MAYKTNVVVDIPTKGITPKNCKAGDYLYYTIRAYRNKNKQPTSDKVCIGKAADVEGKMYPNRNYYEVFKKEPTAFMNTIVKSGVYGVIRHIAENLGLGKIVEDCFPSSFNELLSTAHYMLYGDSALYLMEDWCDEHISFSKKVMSSPEISKMLEEITPDNTRQFFMSWIKLRKSKELIAYDVTSISTYSRGIEDAEWGYNRDKESLPQINYGMFLGQESLLPLYYRTYPGSITDKVHLSFMTEDAEMLDIKRALFVMDKGFYSDGNLKFLVKEKGIRFMIPVPSSLNFYEEMMDEHKDEVVNKYDCFLGDDSYFGKKFEVNKYGFRMNVHIFFNPEKVGTEIQSFKRYLEDMKIDLSRMDKMPSKNTNYCKYFNITQKDGYLVFEENMQAVNRELSYCGFFMIAETIFTLSSVDVLHTYRRRDTIEKNFDNLKNELDIKRMRCHQSQTMYGKMFVAFIALIMRSAMAKGLGDYIKDKHTSMTKILLELDKIKIIYAPNKPSGYRLLNPLTKTQKEILGKLDVPEDFVDNLV